MSSSSSSSKTNRYSRPSASSDDDSADHSPADRLQTMHVLSYNVNFAFARHGRCAHAAKVLRAIHEAQDAQVVMLQETHQGWEAFLTPQLEERFPFSFFHHERGGAGGIAIFSQFELSDVEVLRVEHEVEGSWFPILTCTLRTGDDLLGDVTAVNVHLRPPLTEGGWPDFFNWKTSQWRLAEVQFILERLGAQPDGPVMVVGDFNEKESEPACAELKKHGFVDAVEQYVPSSQPTHLWPVFLAGKHIYTLKHRLDHLMYTTVSMHCTQCTVLKGYEVGASDHLPVVASFTRSSS